MDLEIYPVQHTEVAEERRRTITYDISLEGQMVGSAKVEYFHDLQHALIHNFEINREFRGQGIGSAAVGWLIAHTPYLVGTSYEWESAYGFWSGMRKRFKRRMLPPQI